MAAFLRAVLLGLPLVALAGFVCLHHPMGTIRATVLFAAWVIACALRPLPAMTVALSLLPVFGLASWTGWLALEEFDLILAGLAAGGYLRDFALRLAPPPSDDGAAAVPASVAPSFRRYHRVSTFHPAATTTLALHLIAGLASAALFWSANTASHWHWTQTYFEPLNTLRLLKPILWTAILAPMIGGQYRRHPDAFVSALTRGFGAGLLLCSVAAIWERAAFPGLLNASSDYRSTALFWEMHVGGAALDGYLVLGLPIALWQAFAARSTTGSLVWGVVCLAATYAALTTFSRGVYLGLATAAAVAMAHAWVRHTGSGARRNRSVPGNPLRQTLLALLLLLAIWWAFRDGGYRSALALAGAATVTAMASAATRLMLRAFCAVAITLGLGLGLAAAGFAALMPKGAYAAFGAALIVVLGAIAWHARDSASRAAATIVCLSLGVTYGCAAHVARNWGGSAALAGIAPGLALCLAAAIGNAGAAYPWWSPDIRRQWLTGAALAAATAAVGIFSGGTYMGERLSRGGEDMRGRLVHWQAVVSLLHSPVDWTLGRGPGRFPAEHFLQLPPDRRPGTYQWLREDDNDYLVLGSPGQPVGTAEQFRIAQRVPPRRGRYEVTMDTRNHRATRLLVELCEKHLLYEGRCARTTITLPENAGLWQTTRVALDASDLDADRWSFARLGFFSVSIADAGASVEIDNLRLLGPDGSAVTANASFADGLDGWFTTSDKIHLPWHAKSLPLHLLVEQGAAGVLSFAAFAAIAWLRLFRPEPRRHRLAGPLAASIAAFLTVGLFDSLLDAPRVAFAFLLMLLVASMLAHAPSTRAAADPPN